MAIIEDAVISPGKLELLISWLPTQQWFTDDASVLNIVGSYRFDDPEGEVGVEIMLLRGPGPGAATWQVPLSYRNAPLIDGDEFLICTMEHSALGPRWVYDAIGDPVFRGELARVIAEADTNVAEIHQGPEGPVERPLKTGVLGSGLPGHGVPDFGNAEITDAEDANGAAVIDSGFARLLVTRRIGGTALTGTLEDQPAGRLSGRWPEQAEMAPLAALTLGPVAL